MQEEKHYLTVEDFIEDESFRKAVFEQDFQSTTFWKSWLIDHPEACENAEEAKQILISIRGDVSKLIKSEETRYIDKIMNELIPRSRKKNDSLRILLRVAASVVLIAVVGMGISFLKPEEKIIPTISQSPSSNDWIHVTNTDNTQRLVMFPDGSSALLKKNSTVDYPRIFSQNEREIYLTGESFFEVSKNSQWPFIIHSGELITRVLGTSFTIRAYPTDKEIKVMVKTGKVQLFHRKDFANRKTIEAEVILTNDQQASLINDRFDIVKEKIPSKEILATPVLGENFEFKRTPLASVFSKLEKAYGVDIIFNTEMASSCTLTASLGDEPFAEKLEMITSSIEAVYSIEGKVVTVQLKKACN